MARETYPDALIAFQRLLRLIPKAHRNAIFYDSVGELLNTGTVLHDDGPFSRHWHISSDTRKNCTQGAAFPFVFRNEEFSIELPAADYPQGPVVMRTASESSRLQDEAALLFITRFLVAYALRGKRSAPIFCPSAAL